MLKIDLLTDLRAGATRNNEIEDIGFGDDGESCNEAEGGGSGTGG